MGSNDSLDTSSLHLRGKSSADSLDEPIEKCLGSVDREPDSFDSAVEACEAEQEALDASC